MRTEETFIRIYFIGPAGKNRRERKKVLSKHSDPPTETAFVENGMANIEQRCGAGMNAPSAGLMDFPPLWSTPATTPPITTVISSTLVAPSLIPSVATTKQHIPGGIVNPEAYCDLCQKEFCNKYFLKMHKAKMHGIVPSDGSGTKGTFRLWLHPAERRT